MTRWPSSTPADDEPDRRVPMPVSRGLLTLIVVMVVVWLAVAAFWLGVWR